MPPPRSNRLMASAYLLLLSCLGHRHHVHGAEVLTITEYYGTPGAPPRPPVYVTQPLPAAITPSVAPAAAVTPPAAAAPASAAGPADAHDFLLTIAVQQAFLANLAGVFANNGEAGIVTLAEPPGAAAPSPAAATPSAAIPVAATPLAATPSAATPSAAAITPTTAESGGSSAPGSQAVGAQEDDAESTQARDLAQGGLLGGNPPNSSVDLPATIVFLILFALGAFTHISIYRANAKRGHKFLLSDAFFDFCMIRVVTCIFRIVWIFNQDKGVVLCAEIFVNGGAALTFVTNVILTQRIVRSMHPQIGWSAPFSMITRSLALSVPVITILNVVAILVAFLTNYKTVQDAFLGVVKFGVSYNLVVVAFPFVAVFLACSVPGPRPERFGTGSLRVKTSLVLFTTVCLATGASVRTYSFFNPRPALNADPLYSKPVFYTTQFMLEIVVVALYALLRFDLLFHIPNGSHKPGDYSAAAAQQNGAAGAAARLTGDPEKLAALLTRQGIEDRIATSGLPYQILTPAYAKSNTAAAGGGNDSDLQPIYAVFFPTASARASGPDLTSLEPGAELPPRPERVSRRDSIAQGFQRRSSRVPPVPPISRPVPISVDGKILSPRGSAFVRPRDSWGPQGSPRNF